MQADSNTYNIGGVEFSKTEVYQLGALYEKREFELFLRVLQAMEDHAVESSLGNADATDADNFRYSGAYLLLQTVKGLPAEIQETLSAFKENDNTD